MAAIVKIQGLITSKSIWEPDENKESEKDKKPYLSLGLLQINDRGSEVIKVKDKALKNMSNYNIGENIELNCFAYGWGNNRGNGVSYNVYEGETNSIELDLKDIKQTAK